MVSDNDFQKIAASMIEKTFRELLETKHLYQSIEIPTDGLSLLVEQTLKRERSLQAQAAIFSSSGGSGRLRTEKEISDDSWTQLKARYTRRGLQTISEKEAMHIGVRATHFIIS